ncbi:MAG: RHS repeat-associated core domain-containing protein, partial [Candidatus Sulfotelmatobacter sp.]
NTGRMTNYTFTVNGATDSGVLTWNSNWTLSQLAITDDINSGGSQTCTYNGYDNLGRLLGVTCGSVWSQTFSYDPFGNITKSGSSAWAPGYNEATNHASPPITYDNNGNMTNDTLRTYAYYVDNKLGSINSTTCNIFGSTDGTCILYDAFGREVERGVNGAYTEVMYTPVGKTAIMNGQTTTVSAYFPLPGGATYYQTGSTGANGYFWHKDWLGSARLASSITNRTPYFDRAFAPFGESYSNFGNAAGFDFTGDTQDSFSGLLYDTPSRDLHPGQGRFLSPDPAGLSAVDPSNPQSLNRYAYALNSPLTITDPSGMLGSCQSEDPDPEDANCVADAGAPPLDPLNLPPNSFTPPPIFDTPDVMPDFAGDIFQTVNVDGGTADPVQLIYVSANPGTPVNKRKPWDIARAGVSFILSRKNGCSAWLNGAASSLGPNLGSANSFFSNTWIFGYQGPANEAATTSPGENVIYVNYNGAFFPGSQPSVGDMYPPGTTPAQMTILLHELAHQLYAIPADAFSPPQSMKNTTTVVGNCSAAINGD